MAACLAACGGQTSGPGAGSASLSGDVAGTTFTVASVVAGIGSSGSSSTCSSGPDGGPSCVTTSSGQTVVVALTNRADATCEYIQSQATATTQTSLASFDVLLLGVYSQTVVTPGTYAVSDVLAPTPGTAARLQTSTASCGKGLNIPATSGTITLTQAGPGEVAGSYSVTFGTQGTLTGSFDVPVCNLPDAGATSSSGSSGPPICKP